MTDSHAVYICVNIYSYVYVRMYTDAHAYLRMMTGTHLNSSVFNFYFSTAKHSNLSGGISSLQDYVIIEW